ncbi:hypothetical protein [Clostridium sp. OS1-26]|uniref:hypothetical protein n=1 Tax=Clostridium sp. OS1-26 TaxID=3070681 RepID=UPI0027E0765D|nr:hypothetical protein [Clostridium sp. OS1-26]WML35829.1 hypothetical protein RCG18_03515 [Clostridium sp. OS1-26]
MIYNNRYCFVVRNSKSIFYRFTLNNNKNLFLQSYNYKGITSSSIFKEKIIDFSVSIDSLDKLHVLYTSVNGNIKYTIYPSNFQKDVTIFNAKDRGFHVLFLTLKIIKFKPHIFYILENKSHPSHHSIYHGFWNNNNFHNTKIDDIVFSKYMYPYTVDIFNNNIYLFYTRSYDNSFTIKLFDVDLQTWSNYEDKIFVPSANNTNFLINDKNIALLCYNNSFNKNIQTFVKYKELGSPDSNWSKPIMISDGTTNSTHANIINKEGATYIIWEENGQIVYRKSFYGKNDWGNKNSLIYKKENFFTGVYLSNHKADGDYKGIFTTFATGAFPYPIINLENKSLTEFYIDKDSSTTNLFVPINKSASNHNKKEKIYIEELQSIIDDKDKKIIELSQHNLILKDELDQKSKQLEILNQKLKKSWFLKFFKFNL